MKKLTNKDLLSLEEYDSNRENIKTEVIESKKKEMESYLWTCLSL